MGGVTSTTTTTQSSTTEVAVSCDADNGVDHYVYADPDEDMVAKESHPSTATATATTMIETTAGTEDTGTSCEMGTSYEPPTETQDESTNRLMRIFEREMQLGPSLGAHIPSFISEGLAQLRSVPEGTLDMAQEAQASEEQKGEKTEPKKCDGRISKQSEKVNIQFERYYRQL